MDYSSPKAGTGVPTGQKSEFIKNFFDKMKAKATGGEQSSIQKLKKLKSYLEFKKSVANESSSDSEPDKDSFSNIFGSFKAQKTKVSKLSFTKASSILKYPEDMNKMKALNSQASSLTSNVLAMNANFPSA